MVDRIVAKLLPPPLRGHATKKILFFAASLILIRKKPDLIPTAYMISCYIFTDICGWEIAYCGNDKDYFSLFLRFFLSFGLSLGLFLFISLALSLWCSLSVSLCMSLCDWTLSYLVFFIFQFRFFLSLTNYDHLQEEGRLLCTCSSDRC